MYDCTHQMSSILNVSGRQRARDIASGRQRVITVLIKICVSFRIFNSRCFNFQLSIFNFRQEIILDVSIFNPQFSIFGEF